MPHWTLVDVLVLMPSVSAEDVKREAEDFYQPRRLGEHMVRRGVLTHDQLELALVRQRLLNHTATREDSDRLAALRDRAAIKRSDAVTSLLGAVVQS